MRLLAFFYIIVLVSLLVVSGGDMARDLRAECAKWNGNADNTGFMPVSK
jgi:hypothetical protein